MDYREEFKKRYIRFLETSQIKGLDAENAERIAESVAQKIDCEEYIRCSDSALCQLCADENPEKADGYALTDVATAIPADSDRPKALSECEILPIAVPVCKKCRQKHRMTQLLPTLSCTVIVVCALIITYMPTAKQALYEANLFVPAPMRPFFVFAIAVAVAILLSTALRRILIDSFSTKTVFNPLKIKGMSFLSEGKWQKLYQNRQYKIIFSSEKPAYMCCDTADTAQFAADEALEIEMDDVGQDVQTEDADSSDDE